MDIPRRARQRNGENERAARRHRRVRSGDSTTFLGGRPAVLAALIVGELVREVPNGAVRCRNACIRNRRTGSGFSPFFASGISRTVQAWCATAIGAALLALAALAPGGHVGAQEPRRESNPKPRVQVLATGGTISNLGNDARRTGNELVDAIPRIREIADVTVEQFSNVASGAVTEEMWRRMAVRIRELQRSAAPPDGFVLTHGTDTMEETAFFLSLTVGGCAPVVVTGAMRQANAVGADGPANLLNAIRTAVAPAARGRGTMVLMNDEIFAAHDVTKSNTTRLDAFTAPNAGVLGLADPDTVVFRRPAPAARDGSACPPALFDIETLAPFPRVDVIYAHVGADSVAVDALVAAGAKGLILAGVGRGGSTPTMGRALRRAADKGVVVGISNRTGSGRVGVGAARDSLAALPAGRGASIGTGDLNPQKARVLLMLALAARFDLPAISLLFSER